MSTKNNLIVSQKMPKPGDPLRYGYATRLRCPNCG